MATGLYRDSDFEKRLLALLPCTIFCGMTFFESKQHEPEKAGPIAGGLPEYLPKLTENAGNRRKIQLSINAILIN